VVEATDDLGGASSTRPSRRFLLVAGLVVAVALAAGLASVALAGSGDDDARDVTSAEAFDLPALRGDDRVRLADLRGAPVVVNFFASWCTTCDTELPDFTKVAGELGDEVAFVFVNANDEGNGSGMAERHDLFAHPVARDVGGERGNGLYRSVGGTRGMPITAFFDADGRQVDVRFGGLTAAELRRIIDGL
jgi:thiol-disulfide isomerase/thioredoxin